MITHANKKQENNSPSATNTVALKQKSNTSTFQLVDNRRETEVKRQLYHMANIDSTEVLPVQKKSGLEEEEELLQGKFKTTQRQELEEEELLQGKFKAVQQKGLEEEELQMKAAPLQKKSETLTASSGENKTGLPDNLKNGIENLSGYSMDDVKVHYNSDQPAQLNAHAYAQGTDIHLASGQDKHLPHEAWHVVQQKQGRVQPTLQKKGNPSTSLRTGVQVNDDVGLEKEADLMGAKAENIISYIIQSMKQPS